MNTIQPVVALLTQMQSDDKMRAEQLAKVHGAATFCAGCGDNTHIGLRPFWHRFARHLCDNCGDQYENFLVNLGAK